MSENNTKSDQIEIGALWKKEGKSQKFLAGNLDLAPIGINKQVPVVIFTNKFKQKDTHPDLRVYLSKPKDGAPAPKKSAAPVSAPVAVAQAASDDSSEQDII